MGDRDSIFEEVGAGKSKIFVLDISGEKGDTVVEGQFHIRYPSAMDSIKIGTVADQIRGNVPLDGLDDTTILLSRGIALLRVLCVKAPKWANPFEELSEDIIFDVILKYNAARSSFRDNSDKEPSSPEGELPDADADGSSESDGSASIQ